MYKMQILREDLWGSLKHMTVNAVGLYNIVKHTSHAA